MPKYLVIRFSSIGDIVLASPVIRCIKKQVPDAEIHFVTKSAFRSIVEHNPHLTKIISFQKDINEVIPGLRQEDYDFVIDLHHNLRSARLKRALGRPSASFPKLNVKKWLLTTFKVNKMPAVHVVDRYFKAVEKIGVTNDKAGLDYFIPPQDQVKISALGIPAQFIAVAIGAQFATKRLPAEKLVALVQKLELPVVLLGGETDFDNAEQIAQSKPGVINMCGRLNLHQSASVVQQAQKVVTHDTGLMHIASAFQKPIISIWGNTVPDFGMYPYLPQKENFFTMHEVKDLPCRPCSKIGYAKCPKGHFKCMNDQNLDAIANDVNRKS